MLDYIALDKSISFKQTGKAILQGSNNNYEKEGKSLSLYA